MMTRQEAIARLCKLTEEVGEVVGWQTASDCFCGEGGLNSPDAPKGWELGAYRNDGKHIEFIETAVREKIEFIERAIHRRQDEWQLRNYRGSHDKEMP